MKKIFTKSEHGNVLFVILIAITLFVAIVFALSKDSGNTENTVSDIKLEKQVEQLLSHMNIIKTKVVTMIDVNGVFPSSVSAIKPGDVGFDTSPHIQKIYHPLGGGIEYTNSIGGTTGIVYNNSLTITGIGTASADIAMIANIASLKYCQMLNKKLYNSTNVPMITDATATNMLTPVTATLDDATTCSATGGCDNVAYQCLVSDGSSGTIIYVYHHLLYAR